MYKNIDIKNFRNIRHLNIEDLGRINVLLGKNNSGKTTVLESLFLLFGASNPELILRIHDFRDLFLKEANDLSFIFHNLDFNNTIKIRASSGNQNEGADKDFREISISPSYSSGNTITIEAKAEKKAQADVKSLSYDSAIKEKEINELVLDAIIKKKHSQKIKSKLTLNIDGAGNVMFNLTPPLNYTESLYCTYVTPKIPLALNLQKELEHLVVNKQQDEFIAMLKAIDPRITSISFGTNQMIYVDVGMQQLIPLNLSGDGLRRYLSLLLTVYNSRGGAVLIDELENGLHFSTLVDLWDSLIRLSQKLNVQLFITTHNIETLRALKSALEKDSNQGFQTQVKAYTLRDIGGEHKSYKYDFESFEHAINQRIELR